jgi:hypothetical protein
LEREGYYLTREILSANKLQSFRKDNFWNKPSLETILKKSASIHNSFLVVIMDRKTA